jgi:3-deoxy-D-manno-octulosonic-acid transferase
MFFLYNALLALATPFLLSYYLLRGLRSGKYYGAFRQRLGCSLEPIPRSSIWLHAVSVGEVLSCEQLVAGLRRRLPNARILISTTTATGQKMAREKLGRLADEILYAPLDFPFAVRRTLRRARPRLLIVAETEIWPNLFREAKRFGAGLLLVNARISDRSAPRYRRFRFFFRRVLRLPDAILAQSPLDCRRLLDAGAPQEKVHTGGNLKFDFQPAERAAASDLRGFLDRTGARRVILAGSTREGEEAHVIAAFRHVSCRYTDVLLILAPRHPERFDAVAAMLSGAGVRFIRRSRLDPRAALELPGVLLLDSLGELASVYPLAHAVFVGGSLVDWGGHNVLEPAFAARPVVVGPHMQNFRAIADALLAAGAMIRINGAQELGPALLRLLDNPDEAALLGERARRLAESHRGATGRAVEWAERLYHQGRPDAPPGSLARLLLWGPARIWEAAARLREHAYRSGWLARRKLAGVTVSVGNVTAGGTGKTPLILWLIEQLEARGLRCAVLTRGYGRSAPERIIVLAPGARDPVVRTGDEAQIVRRHFRIPLGIAADRYRAGLEIERRFHPDVFLLDDGFQHQQLARDLDIVLIDVTAPFGGREMLPAGRLREPLSALARADVIVFTRAESWEKWDGLQQEVRRYNRRAPVFFARIEPVALVKASTGGEEPVFSLADRPVLAFCGVANPDAFWRTLESIGMPVVKRVAYPDHHRYSPADAAEISALARRSGADALVTTEKDLVNLPYPLPALYWVKTRVAVEGAEELLHLIPNRDREGVAS